MVSRELSPNRGSEILILRRCDLSLSGSFSDKFDRVSGTLVQIYPRRFAEKWMESSGPDCNTMLRRLLPQSSAIDETSVTDDRSLKYEINIMSKEIKKRHRTCARQPERFFPKRAGWLDRTGSDLGVLVPTVRPEKSLGGRP